MPVTPHTPDVSPARPRRLAPDACALVMVDHLTGFLSGVRTIAPATYLHNVAAVAKMAGPFGLPAFVLGDEGGFRGRLMAPIAEHLGSAPRFPRHTPSGWRAEGLPEAVAATGRRKLVMGGISLDNCLMQTALDALGAGYEVFVLPDISGTDHPLVEHAALARLVQAGAVPTTWVGPAAELMGDWQSPHGEGVGKLYQEHSTWGQAAA